MDAALVDTSEQLQVLRESAQAMQLQLWILGGLLIGVLSMLAYLSKASHEDIKRLLQESMARHNQHDFDIATLKGQNNIGSEVRMAGEKITDAINESTDNFMQLLRKG